MITKPEVRYARSCDPRRRRFRIPMAGAGSLTRRERMALDTLRTHQRAPDCESIGPAVRPGDILIGAAQKCCSVVFIQLVRGPLLADFDLSDRPPVYKTAALPIELRRRLPKGYGTLFARGVAG